MGHEQHRARGARETIEITCPRCQHKFMMPAEIAFDKRKQRETSRWRAVLSTLTDVGTEFSAKLAGEVVKGAMGL